MTLAELHAHAKRTQAELALTIQAIETESQADRAQTEMLGHALTRLMECGLWIDSALRLATPKIQVPNG